MGESKVKQFFSNIKKFVQADAKRIDFSANQISMFHRFGKNQFNLEDLIEVRQEKLTQTIRRGSQKVVSTTFQLAWEFRNLGTIRIKQFKNIDAWQALLKQLGENELITFFYNKSQTPIRYDLFGTGSHRPMNEYLEDKTAVSVNSLEEIQSWLQSCKYERDINQFKKEDHWLLPSEFEKLKVGDCEDHALWAWQKLHKLGISAEFVTGVMLTHKNELGGHAWVMFRQDNKQFVLETVDKAGSMLYPWEEAKKKYHPGLSIDHALNTYHYRDDV